MPRLTRRQTVAAAAASLGALSGCGFLSQNRSSPAVEITGGSISSERSERRTISVVFERGGEIEYWRKFDVPADGPEDDSGGSANLPVEDIKNIPAVWTVRAFNHHTEQYTTLVLEDKSEDEVRVKVQLPRDGEIQIWKGLI